jgi:predicted RNA binding protein YcfA (HicA-like mRNA interferase family)
MASRFGAPWKLLTEMPRLPSVSGARVVRARKRAGFTALRQKGSHVSLEKRAGEQVFKTVVPLHSGLANGTLSDILKKSAIKLEEYRELL